jgi:hypothetical protein
VKAIVLDRRPTWTNKKKLDIFQGLHEIYDCNLIFCMIVCQFNGLILNNVKKCVDFNVLGVLVLNWVFDTIRI